MTKFQIIKVNTLNADDEPRGTKIKGWVSVSGRLGLVKINKYAPDDEGGAEIRSWAVSEKLFSEIATFLGFSCVKTDFIINEEDKYGIVSYDYRIKGAHEITGNDIYKRTPIPLPTTRIKNNREDIDKNYNYEDIVEILNFYSNDSSLIIKFNKIMLMDALTGESDRHYNNWSILV